MTPHPKGTSARVLFSSVFGPYAQDDEFGSRKINPMELYHNQVTREQGPFSLRMFHRSWGILMIQKNISAPTTVLDFPTREAFAEELRANRYDIVGISSIIVNVGKVREMCRMVRELSPDSTIVIGGHVTAIPGIEKMVDADHIVRGDGIAWMRRFLGEDDSAPIRHPEIVSGFGARTLGLNLPITKGTTAATIIPSVGCPMGCNFCTTSAFFGGKGKYLNFYDTGKELYDVMCEMEGKLDVKSFFMMDENFLLHKRRALELLEQHEGGAEGVVAVRVLVGERDQPVHDAGAGGTGRVVDLDGAGIAAVLVHQAEGRRHDCADAANCGRHGIKLLGSTIVGLEHHTPENIEAEIEHAVAHDTDFHQFMLYTPVPGTPLYFEMKEQGRMLPGREPGGYPRAARVQFRACGDFARRIRSAGWISRSGAISSATVRVFIAFAAPRWTGSGGTRMTPMRGCGSVSPARRGRWAAATRRRCGRWSSICAASIRRSREQVREVRREIGREFGLFSRVISGCWVRTCCGPRGAKPAGLPRGRLTSRPPLSSAATGRPRSHSRAPFPGWFNLATQGD